MFIGFAVLVEAQRKNSNQVHRKRSAYLLSCRGLLRNSPGARGQHEQGLAEIAGHRRGPVFQPFVDQKIEDGFRSGSVTTKECLEDGDVDQAA